MSDVPTRRAHGLVWYGFAGLIGLVLLIVGAVAAWCLLPARTRTISPATVMVTRGEASVVLAGSTKPERLGAASVVTVGSRVVVDPGARVHLIFFEGSIAEVTGPAEVRLDRSEQLLVRKSLLASGTEAEGESTNWVALHVARGDVLLEVPSGGGKVTLSAPGTIVAVAPNTRSSVTVADDSSQRWGAHAGAFKLLTGMPSDDSQLAAYLIEQGKEAGMAVVTTPTTSDLQELALSSLAVESAAPTMRLADRITLTRHELPSGLLAYFQGTSAESDRTLVVIGPLPTARAAIEIPGTRVETVTQQRIAQEIAKELDLDVTILGSNRALVRKGSYQAVLGVTVVAGEVRVTGLPADIDVSEIRARFKNELEKLPPVLSVSSVAGVANIRFIDDPKLKFEPVAGAGPAPETLGRLSSSPYYGSIPLPREISTDWKIMGVNLVLALLFAFALGEFLRWTRKQFGENATKLMDAVALRNKQGLFSRFWGKVVTFPGMLFVVVLINGLFNCFLKPDFKPLEGDWILTVVNMTLVAGLVGNADTVIKSHLLRRWNLGPGLVLEPSKICFSAIWVGASRWLGIAPGVVYVSAGGLEHPDLSPARERMFAGVSIMTALSIAGAAWFGAAYLPALAPSGDMSALSQGGTSLLGHAQNLLLMTMVAALMRLFSSLIPLKSNPGAAIYNWSRTAWLGLAAVSTFFLIHLLINRAQKIDDAFGKRLIIVAGLSVGLLALATLLRIVGRRVSDSSTRST